MNISFHPQLTPDIGATTAIVGKIERAGWSSPSHSRKAEIINKTMLHQVKDLSPEQKHAAEILLGHAVSEDEAVSIIVLDATVLYAHTRAAVRPRAKY